MGIINTELHNDDDNGEDTLQSSTRGTESADYHMLGVSEFESWHFVKGAKLRRSLILKLLQLDSHQNSLRCLGNKIPRHLVSLDENYLQSCLELVHTNWSKADPCFGSVNLNSFYMGFTPDGLFSLESVRRNRATVAGVGNMMVNPVGQCIIGSVMGRDSMMSILKSPIFQRFVFVDESATLGKMSLFENKRCIHKDFMGSPSGLSINSSPKPGKETTIRKDHVYGMNAMGKSRVSASSGQSVVVDHFSSPSSQGMLHFTWNRGNPCFSFSVDDRKEYYVANALKVEFPYDKALDYVYSFYVRPSDQKEHDHSHYDFDLVGKMKVATSFLLCSNNSKLMETEFVLVGMNENQEGEMVPTMNQNIRKSNKLSKVTEIFKTGRSFKHKKPSIFCGTSTIVDNYYPEISQEKDIKLDQIGHSDLAEGHFPPNLELVAIVVKDYLHDDEQKREGVGGWGLKFLQKATARQDHGSCCDSGASEGCQRSGGDCSTSMDIIVPAGAHGGSRTRNGGPSGLVQRWKSGGHCDCGGWDIGCPLTVLKTWARNEQSSMRHDLGGVCKSFDVSMEGSKQGLPKMKMENIQDGLYLVNFQSSLSALQCFSIAVAIIHSQTRVLRPEHVHN